MKPSERIMQLARETLDKEKEKGAILFSPEAHQDAVLDAIMEYLDELSITE